MKSELKFFREHGNDVVAAAIDGADFAVHALQVFKELRREDPARQPEARPVRKRAVGDQRNASVEIPDRFFVFPLLLLNLRVEERRDGGEQQENREGVKSWSPAKHRGFQHKRVYPLWGGREKESTSTRKTEH